jgi:CheY-like chemotaxis protein
VTSTVGKGSRFDVFLPVDTGLVPNRAPVAQREEHPMATARSLKILVVDDEAYVLRAFRRILVPPHQVVLAEGGARAVDILKLDVEFDAIVCDLMMPHVDGVMLYELISQQAPQLLERIIFMSGGAFTERAEALASSVRNIILEKPVAAEDLRQAIAVVSSPPAEATRDLLLPDDRS